ncbi:hypothetical protein [Vibrio astriarenae]|uniref:hypothetical protein n=1 Tax=Vibrio astriarenae TaxID=1481923 RepID=UPI0037364484
MARFNFPKITQQARQIIREAGAQFVMKNDKRKRKGYVVMDGVQTSWRDDHLTETETATCMCDIEVPNGAELYFPKLKRTYRVIDCAPEMPNGDVIYWSVTISI